MKRCKVPKLRKMRKSSQASKSSPLTSSPANLTSKEALPLIKKFRVPERLKKPHKGTFDDLVQMLTKVEYKRLKKAIPSVAKVKRVSKVILLNEATLYIQRLHEAVLKKLAGNSKIHLSSNFRGAMMGVPLTMQRVTRRYKSSATRRKCEIGMKRSLKK